MLYRFIFLVVFQYCYMASNHFGKALCLRCFLEYVIGAAGDVEYTVDLLE